MLWEYKKGTTSALPGKFRKALPMKEEVKFELILLSMNRNLPALQRENVILDIVFLD